MSNLVFVDCEASMEHRCPAQGPCTEFGAVLVNGKSFHGELQVPEEERAAVWARFAAWLKENVPGRPLMVSDNPAYDWQWINDGFHRYYGSNPFGHSARRIGDFYAGLVGNFRTASNWKRLRRTPHDHNPVNDARGNMEAFVRIMNGER